MGEQARLDKRQIKFKLCPALAMSTCPGHCQAGNLGQRRALCLLLLIIIIIVIIVLWLLLLIL